MADSLTRLAVLLLRPVERYHAWRWKRAYRAGKFRRPVEPKAAVTTRCRCDDIDLPMPCWHGSSGRAA